MNCRRQNVVLEVSEALESKMDYPQIYCNNPSGWSDWIYPNPLGYKFQCCTCGLVHEFQFKTVNFGGKTRIVFRLKRDDNATRCARRKIKKKKATK